MSILRSASAPTLTDLLFQRSEAGLCLIAPDGTVLRANPEWLRSTGFTLDDVVGADIIALFPSTRDMALAMHARARAGYHVEVPRHAQSIDGRETWWEGSIDPVPMEGGTGLLITAREVGVARLQGGGANTAELLDRLRAKEVQFQALIEDLQSGVALIDSSGAFSVFNRRFLEIFGLDPDSSIENVNSQEWSAWQVCDEAGRPLHLDEHPVRRTARTGQAVREQLVGVRRPRDGELRWLLVTAEPLRAPDGSLVQVICTFHDVTERIRGEEALRSSEARFRRVFDNAAMGIAIVASEGTFELCNPAFARIVGYGPDELLRMRFPEIVHPDDLQAALESSRRLKAGEVPFFEEEGRYVRKDGSSVWVRKYVCLLGDGSERPPVVVLVTDIEAHRRAEQALRESEERLRVALEAARYGTVDVNVETGEIAFDARTRQMWAAGAGERVDLDLLLSRIHPEDRESMWTAFSAALAPASDGSYHAEYRILWPDGSVHWLTGDGRVLFAGEGAGRRAVRVLGVQSDTTEKKQAEAALVEANERLREADRRKDEFLGMLSHELRNPLSPIRNSAYILRHAPAGSEQSHRAGEVIERQAEHLTRLVDDLLDVTRVARGRIELRRARADLREIVHRAAEDHRLSLEDRGVAFTTALPAARLWADVDATRITQIVGNLLHNAAKFTRRGDEVALTLDAADGQAELRVRDTGAGIEPALLPHVFEPFVQGERTLARTEGGLGLGLALVKGIAELHGGTVAAASAGTGLGAEFVVRLPLAEVPASQGTGRVAEPGSRRRILVVDDNPDAAESLADLLRLQRHEVEVAFDGPSALSRLDAGTPDVILCDIGLPGMSGYDVARAVRAAKGNEVRLIALSGYAQPEDVERALEAGFHVHLAKPPHPEELARALS